MWLKLLGSMQGLSLLCEHNLQPKLERVAPVWGTLFHSRYQNHGGGWLKFLPLLLWSHRTRCSKSHFSALELTAFMVPASTCVSNLNREAIISTMNLSKAPVSTRALAILPVMYGTSIHQTLLNRWYLPSASPKLEGNIKPLPHPSPHPGPQHYWGITTLDLLSPLFEIIYFFLNFLFLAK